MSLDLLRALQVRERVLPCEDLGDALYLQLGEDEAADLALIVRRAAHEDGHVGVVGTVVPLPRRDVVIGRR